MRQPPPRHPWGSVLDDVLAILAFASFLWFVLQLRWRLLVADEIEDDI